MIAHANVLGFQSAVPDWSVDGPRFEYQLAQNLFFLRVQIMALRGPSIHRVTFSMGHTGATRKPPNKLLNSVG